MIRLTKQEAMTIETNNELVSQVAMADVLLLETDSGYQQEVYKRPLEEIEARGFPFDVRVVTFRLAHKRDCIALAQTIRKIKDLP